MRKTILGISAIFAIFVIIGVILNIHHIRRLHHVVHLFDEGRILDNFLDMESSFKTRLIEGSPRPSELPKTVGFILPDSFEFEDSVYSIESYLEYSRTSGLLLIRQDSIIFESYHNGLTPNTTHIGWSVSKSFVSALVGIAEEEGHIESIHDPVTKYLPELAYSGYNNVPIIDILQMSSGVKFDEDYRDPRSDINRFGRYFAVGKPLEYFVMSLHREHPPGTYRQYVSMNTQVLGMLLAKVTGRTLSDYLKEKIWDPAGMEHDAQWVIDNKGAEMALGGMNATLRDYGRFGLLFLNEGKANEIEIIPSSWAKASVEESAPRLGAGDDPGTYSPHGYGYHWWVANNGLGDFFAAGVYNQYIYVSPRNNVVIVKLSANHHFREAGDRSKDIHVAMLRAIADATNELPDQLNE